MIWELHISFHCTPTQHAYNCWPKAFNIMMKTPQPMRLASKSWDFKIRKTFAFSALEFFGLSFSRCVGWVTWQVCFLPRAWTCYFSDLSMKKAKGKAKTWSLPFGVLSGLTWATRARRWDRRSIDHHRVFGYCWRSARDYLENQLSAANPSQPIQHEHWGKLGISYSKMKWQKDFYWSIKQGFVKNISHGKKNQFFSWQNPLKCFWGENAHGKTKSQNHEISEFSNFRWKLSDSFPHLLSDSFPIYWKTVMKCWNLILERRGYFHLISTFKVNT